MVEEFPIPQNPERYVIFGPNLRMAVLVSIEKVEGGYRIKFIPTENMKFFNRVPSSDYDLTQSWVENIYSDEEVIIADPNPWTEKIMVLCDYDGKNIDGPIYQKFRDKWKTIAETRGAEIEDLRRALFLAKKRNKEISIYPEAAVRRVIDQAQEIQKLTKIEIQQKEGQWGQQ